MDNSRKIIWKKAVYVLLALFLLIDVYALSSPSEWGLCIRLIPDSLENVLGAWNLVHYGRFGIILDGAFHPSRYLPWCSLMFHVPVFLFTSNILHVCYILLFWVAASLVLMFILGRDMKNISVGAAAAACLFLQPSFISMSRVALTEIPYLVLLLLMLYFWQKLCVSEKLSAEIVFAYGLFTGLGGAVRCTAYPMLLLVLILIFVREKTRWKRIGLSALALVPALLFLILGALFSKTYFGSFFRSGYQYWCPVPYDFPYLVFNLKYVPGNISALLRWAPSYAFLAALAVNAAYFYLVRRKKAPDGGFGLWTAHINFLALQTLILLVLYLPYFYEDPRFFVFPSFLIIPATLKSTYEILGTMRLFNGRGNVLTAVLIVFTMLCQCAAFAYIPVKTRSYEGHFIVKMLRGLELCDKQLPENAVLISSYDPALAEHLFVGKSSRKHIPFDRNPEYASKIIARRSTAGTEVKPANAFDHLCPQLLRYDFCSYAFPYVFTDDPATVGKYAGRKPVFISNFSLTSGALEKAAARFRLVPKFKSGSDEVFELEF